MCSHVFMRLSSVTLEKDIFAQHLGRDALQIRADTCAWSPRCRGTRGQAAAAAATPTKGGRKAEASPTAVRTRGGQKSEEPPSKRAKR